ncbi:MAG: hypothetical protein QOK37_2876 [Thermoanaerobaculia bacterium]|jgi:hypothetical protein|nr:hypothetical protein [Thermoanaerobaculia bacterium]
MTKKRQVPVIVSLPPDEFIIHPKIVVTRQSGEAILKKMRSGKATKALRDLMHEDNDSRCNSA